MHPFQRCHKSLPGSRGPKPQPAALGGLFLPPGPGSPSHWAGVSQVPESCVGFPRHDLSARAPGPWGALTPVGLGQGPARPSGRRCLGEQDGNGPRSPTPPLSAAGKAPTSGSQHGKACPLRAGVQSCWQRREGTQPQHRLRDPVQFPSEGGGRREP